MLFQPPGTKTDAELTGISISFWHDYVHKSFSDYVPHYTRQQLQATRGYLWARLVIADSPLGPDGRLLCTLLEGQFKDWKTNRIVGQGFEYQDYPYLNFIQALGVINTKDKQYRAQTIMRVVDRCLANYSPEILDQDVLIHTYMLKAWEAYNERRTAKSNLQLSKLQ